MGNQENASRRRPYTVSFRVSGAELRLIEAAAESNGDSRAGWCRQHAVRHARAAALADGVAAAMHEMEDVDSTGGNDGGRSERR